jgi:hypothetical protein
MLTSQSKTDLKNNIRRTKKPLLRKKLNTSPNTGQLKRKRKENTTNNDSSPLFDLSLHFTLTSISGNFFTILLRRRTQTERKFYIGARNVLKRDI